MRVESETEFRGVEEVRMRRDAHLQAHVLEAFHAPKRGQAQGLPVVRRATNDKEVVRSHFGHRSMRVSASAWVLPAGL